MGGEASADTCGHIGDPSDWNTGLSWSCGHPPGPADTAFVNFGDHPIVTSNPLPEPGCSPSPTTGGSSSRTRRPSASATCRCSPAPSPAPVAHRRGRVQKVGPPSATFSLTNQGSAALLPTSCSTARHARRRSDAHLPLRRRQPRSPEPCRSTHLQDHRPVRGPARFRSIAPPGRAPINAPHGHLIHAADHVHLSAP